MQFLNKLFYKIILYVIITALQVHVSGTCKDLLCKLGGYELEERGYIDVKVSI